MSYVTEHPAVPALGRRLTLEEWASMDEDEPGELVDGRLEEEEVPDLVHELVAAWLMRILGNWLGSRGFVHAMEGTMQNVPGCEGLTIDLDEIWSRISRLQKES